MARVRQYSAAKVKQQGYTLVEVLVAMVILVSLMFTANYSYSMYSQFWAGRLGSFDRTMFYFRGMLQVKDTIDAALPYVVADGETGYGYYFLGREEGFTFVTAAPIFAVTANDAAVVRLFREKTADGYQLIYEEAPLSDTLLVDLDQQLTFKYRTVLMKTTEPLHFSYYGWALREHKYELLVYPDKKPSWSNSYDGAQTRLQPLKVKLHIGNEALVYQLNAGSDELLGFYLQERVH